MPGFVNVSHMTNRQIQRMGHADDDGGNTYRTRTNTKKIVLNYNADDVWGAAVQAQRINNAYVKLSMISESDPNLTKLSNRMLVEQMLADPFTITDEDREEGKKVRAYYQAFTFKILQGKRLNEFDNTAMLIANRDAITSTYDIAVIASLPSVYERGVKRKTVEQRISFAKGGYVSAIGNKVSLTVEVLRSIYSQKWATTYITAITSDEQVVFFAYKNELEVGKMIDIYGTVKAHRDNTTQLNRVKVIV